jgi:chromosome partitioning protein
LEVTGIIACMFDARTSLARAVHEKIKEYFGDKVFKTVIRKNIRLAESPSHGLPVMVYDPEAAGAADYMALAKEVVAREGGAAAAEAKAPEAAAAPGPAASAAPTTAAGTPATGPQPPKQAELFDRRPSNNS